jgi:predicted SAM-dependent methyltransferase
MNLKILLKQLGVDVKLNIGCGTDYKEGFINLDYNKEVKADVYTDILTGLPFPDNTFDFVYASHIIEHIPRGRLYHFLEELSRICKPKAIIEIYAPHCSSPLALGCPYHYTYWSVSSFKTFETETTSAKERYSLARFKVLKCELHLTLRDHENYPRLKLLNYFNFLFNFGRTWQLLMEKLWYIGFDEIKYIIEVAK